MCGVRRVRHVLYHSVAALTLPHGVVVFHGVVVAAPQERLLSQGSEYEAKRRAEARAAQRRQLQECTFRPAINANTTAKSTAFYNRVQDRLFKAGGGQHVMDADHEDGAGSESGADNGADDGGAPAAAAAVPAPAQAPATPPLQAAAGASVSPLSGAMEAVSTPVADGAFDDDDGGVVCGVWCVVGPDGGLTVLCCCVAVVGTFACSFYTPQGVDQSTVAGSTAQRRGRLLPRSARAAGDGDNHAMLHYAAQGGATGRGSARGGYAARARQAKGAARGRSGSGAGSGKKARGQAAGDVSPLQGWSADG